MMLTFGPLFAVYSGYNLKAFNAYPIVVYSGAYYMLSQIAKMIALAILVPVVFHSSPVEETTFSLEHEILTAFLGIIEMCALYYILSSKKTLNVGDMKVKLLSIGIGWSAAELISKNLIYIFMQS